MRKLRIIITLSLLALMGVAAYILIPAQNTFSLKNITPQLKKTATDIHIPNEVNNTMENIAQQAKNLQEHANNILGATDREHPDQPLQERAFEYGRYSYCKQVVQDYESRVSQK